MKKKILIGSIAILIILAIIAYISQKKSTPEITTPPTTS
jgi:hypothetical protein